MAFFAPPTDVAHLLDGSEQNDESLQVNTLLRGHYADQSRAIVGGNTFICYGWGRPGRNASPDCYVASDVDSDDIIRHDHYRIWVVGKPPDFVLEIAS